MTATAILSVFAGMMIGLRMRVLALVPAMVLAGAAVFVVFALRGDGVPAALGAAATTIVAIQIGYLCSTFAVSLREPAPSAVSDAVAVTAASQSAAGRSAALHR